MVYIAMTATHWPSTALVSSGTSQSVKHKLMWCGSQLPQSQNLPSWMCLEEKMKRGHLFSLETDAHCPRWDLVQPWSHIFSHSTSSPPLLKHFSPLLSNICLLLPCLLPEMMLLFPLSLRKTPRKGLSWAPVSFYPPQILTFSPLLWINCPCSYQWSTPSAVSRIHLCLPAQPCSVIFPVYKILCICIKTCFYFFTS